MALDQQALDTLFFNARTHNAWRPEPVSDALLQQLYEAARWAPTLGNTQPLRLVFVKSAEAKARLDQVKAGLKDGSFVIWKGPIAGQDGKEVLAKDAVADDKFLQGIKFYVKGVEGQVPAGK